MKAIHTLLKQTPAEYEVTIFSLWLEWCQKRSHNEEQLQKLLSNNALFGWWQYNLETFEKLYAKDVAFYYETLDADTLMEVYREYTQVIHKHHSPALIKQALA